jgi:regulator of RNase E activity RraA
VVDGAVRDIAAIRRRAFPVYGVGTCPAGPHKSAGGEWGGSVSCGGAVVNDGDLIVGDEDGVVAVAWAGRHDVLTAARKRTEMEDRWLSELETGRRSADLLGL